MTTDLLLTDGGLETTMLFGEGFELPCFAAFPLLEDERGRAALRRYFEACLDVAAAHGRGFVLDTATWRANPAWGPELGYDEAALEAANRRAVAFARELAAGRQGVLVDGVIGPRGDGYVADEAMTADEAEAFHAWQVGVLAGAGVDRVTGVTLATVAEAVGVVRAAAAAGVEVVASFTVETDGRLPDGTPLARAIAEVDAATGGAAAGFGVNCAHPTHVAAGLEDDAALARVVLLRPNASSCSHEELDAATELDRGDPVALGRDAATLRDRLPGVRVLGGCCGTDHEHLAELATAWGATPVTA